MRRISGLLAGVWLLIVGAQSALAQCPPGTTQIGEQEERQGNTIIVHPVCRRVPAAPVERNYRHSGSGLVGGTGWQLGYYSPVGARPEIREWARRMVREQAEAAQRANPGATRYDERIDFDRYNFAIGIGNVPWFNRDFVDRVFWDQLSNGRATPAYQEAYNSLRGRSFDSLGCHSNGAMICLAALRNRDIQAGDVTLYGPQLTPESLLEWNRLVREGSISSLHIVVAQNDPITPASLLFGLLMRGSDATGIVANTPILFDVGMLTSTLRRLSPDAVVSSFACGGPAYTRISGPFDCHDLRRYSDFRRRCPAPQNGSSVPGTRNPGARGRRAAEPPSPLCRST